jgi:hypothetical protein
MRADDHRRSRGRSRSDETGEGRHAASVIATPIGARAHIGRRRRRERFYAWIHLDARKPRSAVRESATETSQKRQMTHRRDSCEWLGGSTTHPVSSA